MHAEEEKDGYAERTYIDFVTPHLLETNVLQLQWAKSGHHAIG